MLVCLYSELKYTDTWGFKSIKSKAKIFHIQAMKKHWEEGVEV
jgi:hypothetical protein